nr:M48 family metalloprotease [Kibdelosporangium phytohabitans]
MVAWLLLLVVAACALFAVLPGWRARRSRVVPLAAVDPAGEIAADLADLVRKAGLSSAPRVVVDPVAASTGAVVFGRNRRPTVCLHGGLLTRRRADPEGFRAVVLHELAHIRNGDVTITYVTVAAWRVLLALMFVPYLAWYVFRFANGLAGPLLWSSNAPAVVRSLLLMVVLAGLVSLARSDVLRSREFYADITAARWGAAPHGWAVSAAPSPARAGLRRALDSFAGLWRTHPSWESRRAALTDPEALFTISALPMFLAGAAATLISSQVAYVLATYKVFDEWLSLSFEIATAALVTGVVGIALWRTVAHAVLRARRVPSGARTGLWLGAGMAAGELVTHRVALLQWLPSVPGLLVLEVLAGLAFAWWVTQCAHLWLGSWRGHAIRPAMLAGLLAACLGLSAWFTWWGDIGVFLSLGASLDDVVRYMMDRWALFGPPVRESDPLTVLTMAWAGMSGMVVKPLALPVVAVLWVVPLLAWVLRPTAEDRPPHGEALPSLRGPLLAAVIGGVGSWLAVAGVMAAFHARQPPLNERTGFYVLTYQSAVCTALVVVAAVTALVVSALSRRYRLLLALMAAQGTVLLGAVGMLVLGSLDGCLGPLNTVQPTCAPMPASKMWAGFRFILAETVMFTVIAAAAGAAVGAVSSRAWRSRTAAARPVKTGRGGLAARRVVVGVLCVVTVGFTVAVEVETLATRPQAVRQRAAPAPTPPPVSGATRAVEVAAWRNSGGVALMTRFTTDINKLDAALKEAVRNGGRTIDDELIRPACADIDQLTREASRFLPVPEPQAQSLWQTFVTQASTASQDCLRSIEQRNGNAVLTAIGGLSQAAATLTTAVLRIDTVVRGGS